MNKPKIEIIEKDDTHIIYYMHQDIGCLDLYERTKAIERFINNSTQTLEILISNDIREFLRRNGIIIQDGSESALKQAFDELKYNKGLDIQIIDRYYQIGDERIVGESKNQMTCIMEEDSIIGCSMEIRLKRR